MIQQLQFNVEKVPDDDNSSEEENVSDIDSFTGAEIGVTGNDNIEQKN